MGGKNPMVSTTTLYDNEGQLTDPRLQEFASAGRDGRGGAIRQSGSGKMKDLGLTPEFDVCCPNCQERGDFLQEVNKVLKNCIDFCEFPHRCYLNDGRGEIIWKTLGEL
jgi:hypothetical protein